jgi:hypothetical protein
MIAVAVLKQETIDSLPGFKKRMNWFLDNRKELAKHVSYCDRGSDEDQQGSLRLLAIPSQERLRRCLERLVDAMNIDLRLNCGLPVKKSHSTGTGQSDAISGPLKVKALVGIVIRRRETMPLRAATNIARRSSGESTGTPTNEARGKSEGSPRLLHLPSICSAAQRVF